MYVCHQAPISNRRRLRYVHFAVRRDQTDKEMMDIWIKCMALLVSDCNGHYGHTFYGSVLLYSVLKDVRPRSARTCST